MTEGKDEWFTIRTARHKTIVVKQQDIPLFEKDRETRGVVIFCEPGGTGEERLAEYVFEHRPALPIIAFVAGQFADSMPGVRFGHAGAIVEGDRGSTKGKIEKFHWAGIHVAEKFSDIVDLLVFD